MNCDFCGEEIPSRDALACPRCGNPLAKKPEEPRAPERSREISDLVDLQPPENEQAESQRDVPESQDGSPVLDDLADASVPPGVSVAPEEITIGERSAPGPGEAREREPVFVARRARERSLSKWTRSPRRLTVLVTSAILIAAAIAAGLYFGLPGGSKPPRGDPRYTVNEFARLATLGDAVSLQRISVGGAPAIDEALTVLKPYDNRGTASLKKVESRIVSERGDEATVQITKFEVEVLTDSGSEVFDVLEETLPMRMPTRIHLIRKNGAWLINS